MDRMSSIPYDVLNAVVCLQESNSPTNGDGLGHGP